MPRMAIVIVAKVVFGLGVWGASVSPMQETSLASTTATTTPASGYDVTSNLAVSAGDAPNPAATSAKPAVVELGRALASSGWRVAPQTAGHLDEAFHYTFKGAAASIERTGLKPGSYLTPDGRLSPLQAQIDLALPPNRGFGTNLRPWFTSTGVVLRGSRQLWWC
jgi:hypothetical protein